MFARRAALACALPALCVCVRARVCVCACVRVYVCVCVGVRAGALLLSLALGLLGLLGLELPVPVLLLPDEVLLREITYIILYHYMIYNNLTHNPVPVLLRGINSARSLVGEGRRGGEGG